ncbi:hypothetical protein LB467_00070 [Salegentibacter sp. JZCK2]|uniref:hypothetical protein n=1 Tax=Salegentibacter tibetensis TaxID=2873600 RepID=UPI001CCF0144|nr:hypothetical protein [Salegentibacter tibetensis]MBZ9728072.1 hypothetical protein [Salegentibacter tibetensis]
MKKLLFVLSFFFCANLFAQQNDLKNDIIVTTDGQFLQVKVIKVGADLLTFSYPGESVVYELKPDGINKIVFASGRTQNFNSANAAIINGSGMSESLVPQVPKTPGFVENTLAIIPLVFELNGSDEKNLASKATDYIMDLTSGQAKNHGIEVLPNDKAIEKLLEAGINYDDLRQSSPARLREIMGTEYILYVSINETNKDSTKIDKSNYMAEDSVSGNIGQIQRAIDLNVYNPDSKEKAYGMDFSEQVFIRKSQDNQQSVPADDGWKSSLNYLVEQMFSSPVFQ